MAEVRGPWTDGGSEDGAGFRGEEEDFRGRDWEVAKTEGDVNVVSEEEKGSLGEEETMPAATGVLEERMEGAEDSTEEEATLDTDSELLGGIEDGTEGTL